ncbi:hypothetical protein GLOTRDRAFT_138246 [Gloeophyllum trabeum ATCC 11539]|uniref:Integral membrane protein n=1 Tax=Gloeophyllum trabeum (strain ATCC 11539 / FP-39264 / Madison 617) TaxID=670483 RepID=S7QB36_GLOTA|nr:uncharacterized protein GLOTRDRAFT_138246 [Gloeophyllum trabeum ATCC 11539]EPQ56543.1 hypothetical protein GLOTRDRAFT_138246 [Gloeophyllum trabeum ATCC 11539]
MSAQSPNFPSLYDISLELSRVEHRGPRQPGGVYLDNLSDVYRFTFYWILIFSTPFFFLAGTYAFFNLSFPPSHRPKAAVEKVYSEYPLSPTLAPLAPPTLSSTRPNPRRSRITFALLVLLTYAVFAVASAVVGSAVLGCVVYGLYKAGGFSMSTWVPFIWALIQSLVGLTGIWPSVIEII